MKNLRISTLVTIVLLIVGFILAILAFAQASNSEISPLFILIVMLVSALFFAAAAVVALRRKSIVQRVVGLAAVVAAVYMIAFGIFSYSMLRIEVPEEFLESQRTPELPQ